jgi:hypothetical protein
MNAPQRAAVPKRKGCFFCDPQKRRTPRLASRGSGVWRPKLDSNRAAMMPGRGDDERAAARGSPEAQRFFFL